MPWYYRWHLLGLLNEMLYVKVFQTFLMIPSRRGLVDGHCLIVPMNHASSSLHLDEDVFQEMKV